MIRIWESRTTATCLATAALAASCGSDPVREGPPSEANWFAPCTAGADCPSLDCMCGLCTLACTSTDDCTQARGHTRCATVGDPEHDNLCSDTATGVCVEASGGATGASVTGESGSDRPSASGGDGAAGTGGAGLGGRAEGVGTGGIGDNTGTSGARSTRGTSGTGGTTDAAGGLGGTGAAGAESVAVAGGSDAGGVVAPGGAGTGSDAATGGAGTGGVTTAGGADAGGRGGSDARAGQGGTVESGDAGEGGAQGGSTATYQPPPEQRVLFEVVYVNYAWGEQNTGSYVTREGEVYRYDNGSEVRSQVPLPDERTTYEAIAARYGVPELVATVASEELFAMHALVAAAQQGSIDSSSPCRDAGENEYVGWLYDNASSTYSPVLLALDGDGAAGNSAPEAAQLVAWLVQFTDGRFSCTYRPE
jgi:hypothetical protein